MIVPISQTTPPFWIWNMAFRQLYMSSYHLSPQFIPYYLDALRRYRVVYLLGYTSALYTLAREILRSGRQDLRMKVVIANAEPVSARQQRAISAAFNCPVRETYAMAEKVAAAGECEFGNLHLWADVGFAEVLEGTQPVAAESPGELVATGLLNTDMPLIRYRTGDRVVLRSPDATCQCGRSLPLLGSVEGRTDDVIHTPDGRYVGRLDPVFKADLPIREAQIVQDTLESIRVLYVPADGFGLACRQQIVERLQERLGDIEVNLEEVSEIPRSANGKFRAVVCRIPTGGAELKQSNL